MIRIGSLFAGIGGLELGLLAAFDEARIPARVAWQVESDPYCRAVLAAHFPDADRSVIDVKTANATSLGRVDILCGGFPCQDISFAGRLAGIGGEQSGLWAEYGRIIRELRPSIAVVENVPALLARGMGAILGDLAVAGYFAEWQCIRASDVGAPHFRDRLFILAYAYGNGCESIGERAPNDGERTSHGNDAYGCSGTWQGGTLESRMGGDAHGVPDGMDRRLPDRWPAPPSEPQAPWEPPRSAQGVKGRARRLKALGNAVVPRVALLIGRWVIDRMRDR